MGEGRERLGNVEEDEVIFLPCPHTCRNTALHLAAWHNRSDIVELLLANDAVVS